MADYGQLSGSGVQVLGTSSIDRGQLSGSSLQALVTASANRSQFSGSSLHVLVVGPLVTPPVSALTEVQGELAQGVLYIQSASTGTSPQGSRFI